jgi:NAD(P)-dependent dehydrogenase (short-subunit alcohol dehydrogenase family)
MTELGGTLVLVTGGTSGLGLAMARALVDAGARVAIRSRDSERTLYAAADLGSRASGLALGRSPHCAHHPSLLTDRSRCCC